MGDAWGWPPTGRNPGDGRPAGGSRGNRPDHLPLGPCIWTRRDEFESAGRFINQTEWFFLLRGPSFDVRTEGLEALENTFIREYRWWSLDEIRRSTEEFAPRDLADRLHDLVIQGPPASPVEVGR